MPWHLTHEPKVSNAARVVRVADKCVTVQIEEQLDTEAKIENLHVTSFRKLLKRRKSKNDFKIYQVIDMNTMTGAESFEGVGQAKSSKMKRLLEKYKDVFRTDLPKGLPPKRSVDHAIETEPDKKPPHRPLYQLSPAELRAAKEYIVDLLNQGTIRSSKSPYGAPLFFVKDGDKPLRGVVDYRALNRITKRNNAPLPRSDEIFDRLGGARVFSKLYLKTGFHQIRIRPEDIEKIAFNTKYGQFEQLVMPMGL
jgi:hypothetical protein